MKKRILAFILAAVMTTAALAGCGGKENQASEKKAGAEAKAEPEWEKYDQLIADIKKETDLKKREEMLHKAEDMLMDTWAVIPIYYYNDVYLQKTDLKNIYSNLFGFKYFAFAKAPKETLALQISSEPDKLDPALNSSVDGACLAILAFSGLYAYNDEGKLVPELAEGYEMSEDGMTYTFTIKEGLKWSDGEALDAADLVYSWNRLADPETGADYAYLADAIARKEDGTLAVEASEDGRTFTVKLIAPCAYFLDLCAFPAFYPVPEQNVATAAGADGNPGAWCLEAGFVTSGPFRLTGWKHNESMTYEPNENYFAKDKVSLKKIDFMLSNDDAAVYNAFRDGSLQFADTIPTGEMANVKKLPEFHKIPTLGTYYCGFNVKSELFKGKTAQQAADMRHAFSLMINRQYIIDTIAQAGQTPANTFIPEGMVDGNGGEFKVNDDDYTYPDQKHVGYFNPKFSESMLDEARKLLKKAGYQFDDAGMLDASTPISLTYLTNDSEGNVKIGEAMQQDFAAIGIDMKVETREWSVFLNERKAGKFDFAREGWLADYNDPINMLEMWETKSGNNDMQFGR